jgi:lysyl-tRNA synthetase class 2
LPEFRQQYDGVENGSQDSSVSIGVAGRIMSKRASGKKLFFYDLHADGVKIQV